MKKKYKKQFLRVLSSSLAAMMILGSIPASTLAAERSDPSMISSHDNVVNSYSGIVETVAEGMFNFEDEINVYSFKVPESDFAEIFAAVLTKYPELFFVNRGYGYSYDNTNKVYSISPQYNTESKEETDQMLEAFYAEADKILLA